MSWRSYYSEYSCTKRKGEMAGVEERTGSPLKSTEDCDLDPRIKEELDVLNSTSEEINKLEIELDSARAKFRSLLTDASHRLKLLSKKLGRCVNKARPYYELLKESRKAQAEAQRAVVKFHRANGIYRAAKETVALAEERLMSAGDNGEKREFDSAWQEMLNHATIKFMDSEKDKTLSEQEHMARACEVTEIQKQLKTLEKAMPRTIPRSKPYFDLKERLEFQLEQEKLNVEDLVRALQSAKLQYRGALSTLESISEEVHMKRKMTQVLPPRTPGVGAENYDNDIASDLPSINLDFGSEASGDVASINSDDFDVISTDGSEAGDMSPRPEPRSISLPVSPLARENSSSSLNGGEKVHSKPQPLAPTPIPSFSKLHNRSQGKNIVTIRKTVERVSPTQDTVNGENLNSGERKNTQLEMSQENSDSNEGLSQGEIVERKNTDLTYGPLESTSQGSESGSGKLGNVGVDLEENRNERDVDNVKGEE